jgi:hypothetical protein
MIEQVEKKINTQRVMTTTERILTTFTTKVDMEKEYKRSELAKMLTEVFKEIRDGEKGEKKKKAKKEDGGEEKKKRAKKEDGGEEKKKRAPSAYNLYVRDTMPVVKEDNPEMSRQDLMREVGRMWKEKNRDDKEEDVKEEEEEDVKEEVEKEEVDEDVKEEVEKEEVDEVKKVGKKEKKGKKE